MLLTDLKANVNCSNVLCSMIRKQTTATYILLTCTTVSLGSRQIGHIKCAKKTLCIGHKQKQIYLYILKTDKKENIILFNLFSSKEYFVAAFSEGKLICNEVLY